MSDLHPRERIWSGLFDQMLAHNDDLREISQDQYRRDYQTEVIYEGLLTVGTRIATTTNGNLLVSFSEKEGVCILMPVNSGWTKFQRLKGTQ